jgi:hypothetical protein
LEKQNRKLKAQENETLNAQAIKEEIQQISQNQAAILNKIEQVPNLPALVEALQKSQNFQAIGNALSPIATPPKTNLYNPDKNKPSIDCYRNKQKPSYCQYCGKQLDTQTNPLNCWNCGAPINPETPAPKQPKPKQKIKPLDAFAGGIVFIIWLAVSYAILTNGEITAWTIIGLAVFWLFFTVAFRLVIGGILD